MFIDDEVCGFHQGWNSALKEVLDIMRKERFYEFFKVLFTTLLYLLAFLGWMAAGVIGYMVYKSLTT